MTHNGHPIEILDIFQVREKWLAAIGCTDGDQPYVGGDRWPVRTQYATVPLDSIEGMVEAVPAALTLIAVS